jgi:hypothetical protein
MSDVTKGQPGEAGDQTLHCPSCNAEFPLLMIAQMQLAMFHEAVELMRGYKAIEISLMPEFEDWFDRALRLSPPPKLRLSNFP